MHPGLASPKKGTAWRTIRHRNWNQRGGLNVRFSRRPLRWFGTGRPYFLNRIIRISDGRFSIADFEQILTIAATDAKQRPGFQNTKDGEATGFPRFLYLLCGLCDRCGERSVTARDANNFAYPRFVANAVVQVGPLPGSLTSLARGSRVSHCLRQ